MTKANAMISIGVTSAIHMNNQVPGPLSNQSGGHRQGDFRPPLAKAVKR
ncbi:hypothetical protein [Amycolatopsis sp. cmx-11-51]